MSLTPMNAFALKTSTHHQGSNRPVAWQARCALALLAAYLLLLAIAVRDSGRPVTLGIAAAPDPTTGRWLISDVKPTSLALTAGIRPGDILIEIDGAAPPPDGAALEGATQAKSLRPGTAERFEVGEVGRPLAAPNRVAYFLISIVFFAVGAAALSFGHDQAPRALALVCCVGAAGIATLQPVYRQVPWALFLNGFYVPLFTGGFAYLFMVFPVQRSLRLGRWRIPPASLLLPTIPIALSWLLSVMIDRGAAPYQLIRQVMLWSGYLYFALCFLGGCTALVYNWLHTGAGRQRRQLRTVMIGSLLAVLPFLLLSLLPMTTLGLEIVPAELSVLGLICLPAAFGYAILRYQLMDLQLYVRRGLVYSTFAAIITGVYALVLFGVSLLVQGRAGASNYIAIGIMVVAIAVGGQHLRGVLQRRVDRLFDRRSYDYRQQLLEFSRRMSGLLDSDELAHSTTELISQTMGTPHVRLYLYEPGARRYHLWAGAGLPAPPEQRSLDAAHPLVTDLAAGNDAVQYLDVPPEREALVLGLTNKGQPVALLTLGPKYADLPYSSEDLSLLRTVANQLAVATENAQLYGRMRHLYLSTVRSLAATVDAKDAYTHGHSERVAAYARQIAVTLGLPQLEIEQIELAALLHDIGKIGIPDAVLLKPERLDPDEWQTMMGHAELGANILAGNPALAPLVPLVRHHHERYAGGGYPDGLAGEAIPPGAAIIAVADTFDTMTTNRPYRQAPGFAQARAEISRCAGTQFHPRVVAAFLQALESGGWPGQPAPPTVAAVRPYPTGPAGAATPARPGDLPTPAAGGHPAARPVYQVAPAGAR